MTLEQYNDAVKKILADQQSIAQSTAQLAMSGKAYPGDAEFGQLMAKQWTLIQEMAKLNTEMMLGVMQARK
ncbi:MAG TPA: hypothetical protein VHA82_15200 [Ramlibacter sp.]|uniref:hypothetical protein n=1 Tax=Ramlibacter sp. TaxID=1917967 RepID=UPI002C21ECE5|nr:hypothetical protein [Ramlibacter sp.]HVZ45156.1 hypothetical protein [Ramlibacter sp.]